MGHPLTLAVRVVTTLGLALSTTACLQASLNPLILPADSRFDVRLVGVWTCPGETWTFERKEEAPWPSGYYAVGVKTDRESTPLMAWLGDLGRTTYINFALGGGLDLPHFAARQLIGAFTFGRITIEPDRLTFAMLSDGFIDALERAGTLTIGLRRGGDGLGSDVILTARTQELQRFAQAFGDHEAFAERVVLVRRGATIARDGRPDTGSCYSEK